ncbi:probable cytochrome P450 9f2 [Armigeres subalbatus]|uniref:probable cytochrome P450 9f2 n=1 Tax=Armigeres subalbatus TaxID=124917 RepID=UPI002ED5DE66
MTVDHSFLQYSTTSTIAQIFLFEMDLDWTQLFSILVIAAIIYRWLNSNHDYFLHKPIPSMPVWPIMGSTGSLLFKRCTFSDFVQTNYKKYSAARVFGLFDTNIPMYVICDPELIKRIAVTDFDHFMDHRPIFGASNPDHPNLLFEKTLFGMAGPKWKSMRSTLSPAFTGSKMRQMFEFVVKCSDNMVRFYQGEPRGKQYEMKDVFSRFSNDVIATCAFGIEVDSVRKRDNEFFAHGSKMFQMNRLSVVARLIGFRFAPALMSQFGLDLNDQEQNQYFSSLVRETISARETKGILRPDMVHLLMEAKKGLLKHQKEIEQHKGFATVEESEIMKTQSPNTMTELELIAQCLIFFLAGFDTVSTCLTYTAYELALNPEIQDKLFKEIKEIHETLNGEPLNYETLQKMTYMDMVISEVLRKWPAIATLDRHCVQDYEMDAGNGLKFTIERGSGIWFPIHAMHHDPNYYPEPERFLPERFSEQNKANINMGAYLPFGIGPRNCIGSRFALMEVKAIVYHFLLSFSFERTDKTQVPLEIVKGFGPMKPNDGVYLEFRPRIL